MKISNMKKAIYGITYAAAVYYITDSNSIAVMHQPNNHQVKPV